jgi:uncharacterized protein DUF6734
MRAVWSFWSKPYFSQQGSTWLSQKDYLYSCALSLECAKQHFKETILYTDDDGADLLINKLKLPFSKVSTSLNNINHYDPTWWTVGKLYTYSLQKNPFVHIDNDVYLWKALPEHFKHAGIIGQNPEHFIPGSSWYQPEKFDPIIKSQSWLPDEVIWYLKQRNNQMAICCGIMGGSNISLIRKYAEMALKLVNCSLTDEIYLPLYGDNLLIEQYLLSAFINHNQQHNCIKRTQCKPAFLFDSSDDAFNSMKSKQRGFTHLIGGAKRNITLMQRLKNRIYRDYPQHFKKIDMLT